MSNISILRQVIDLQAQAERLIRTGGNMPEIEEFAKYNEMVKSYLLNNISDDFILKYVNTIPSLKINDIETKSNLFIIVISLISGSSATTYKERDKIERALKHIKVISEKYSSYEVMIRNYFDN